MAWATVTGTWVGSRTAANSASHTPSGNSLQQPPRPLEGQAGLARPARSHQGHQPALAHPDRQGVDLGLAAHEGGQGGRKIMGRAPLASKGREASAQARLDHLMEALRPSQAPQLILAQLDRVETLDQAGRHRRQQNLPPVGQPHDPGRSVDGRAEIVTVALDRLSRVQRPSAPANHSTPTPRR